MRDAAKTGYDGVAKSLHWLVAALVLLQFGTKLIDGSAMTEAQRDAWHLAIGPTILLLTLVRLLWRLTHPAPALPADLPPRLRMLANATHWGLYGLLILLPVMGWLAASAYGVRPTILGLVSLPALLEHHDPTGEALGRVHGALALLLAAMAGLHIAGALYHAAFRDDGVFGRMLP